MDPELHSEIGIAQVFVVRTPEMQRKCKSRRKCKLCKKLCIEFWVGAKLNVSGKGAEIQAAD